MSANVWNQAQQKRQKTFNKPIMLKIINKQTPAILSSVTAGRLLVRKDARLKLTVTDTDYNLVIADLQLEVSRTTQ